MREPVISDAVVEAAARILRADLDQSAWNTNEEIRSALTAAILADRAETIEACAKVAEEKSATVQSRLDVGKGTHGQPNYVMDAIWGSWHGQRFAANEIASSIRSMGASLLGKAGE